MLNFQTSSVVKLQAFKMKYFSLRTLMTTQYPL